ncbi:MAG: SdpI family protein [Chitinophagaceae bacterium]|nr:SdpI family protein [Chitinophagaceae bacterium]
MNKYLKELILWAFIALPYVYLATIWNKLPEQVPTHFTIDGVANEWSSKTSLLFIPGALGIGIYFLMLLIPKIDPKKKIQQMGDKYYSLRFILTIFISLLATYLLYLSDTGSIKNPNMLLALIGMLFAILGNYFQTIRPNYFIGIRTPWTLKNEQVWKNTHRLGGWLWIMGGILIAILAFFISDNHIYSMVFGAIIFLLVIVPIVFSYTEFQKEKSILNK